MRVILRLKLCMHCAHQLSFIFVACHAVQRSPNNIPFFAAVLLCDKIQEFYNKNKILSYGYTDTASDVHAQKLRTVEQKAV